MTGGTFTLVLPDQTTGAARKTKSIDSNASAAAVKSALDGLSNEDLKVDVSVTRTDFPQGHQGDTLYAWTVIFLSPTGDLQTLVLNEEVPAAGQIIMATTLINGENPCEAGEKKTRSNRRATTPGWFFVRTVPCGQIQIFRWVGVMREYEHVKLPARVWI